MDRSEILSYIKKKDIILFGAGAKAQNFYECFYKELNICYCVSNNQSEIEFYVKEKNVCEVRDITTLELKPNEFLITCSGDSISMQRQLCDMGLCIGKDFIDSELYNVLTKNKKIALLYGVCQIRAINECLKLSSRFHQSYQSYYYLDYIKYDYYEQSFFYLLLELCDLFIHSSYFSKMPLRRLDTFFKRLNRKCEKISVPIIIFNGFYPRIRQNINENPYCVVSNKSPYSPFSIADENINALIYLNCNSDEIIEKISDVNFFTKDFLIGNLQREFHKIRMAEKFSDIRISDYIEDYFDKERLFLNESHISNLLAAEISKRILKQLTLEDEIDVVKLVGSAPLLHSSEVPLYPSVIHHLQLSQYRGTEKYMMYTYKGIQKVTFYEYARLYIDFCREMKGYIQKGFFPE